MWFSSCRIMASACFSDRWFTAATGSKITGLKKPSVTGVSTSDDNHICHFLFNTHVLNRLLQEDPPFRIGFLQPGGKQLLCMAVLKIKSNEEERGCQQIGKRQKRQGRFKPLAYEVRPGTGGSGIVLAHKP